MNLLPSLDPHALTIIGQFVKERVKEAGSRGVVLGLSGGLDSAVALKLACDVLGPDSVSCIFLPYGKGGGKDRPFASEAASSAGVELKTMDITPVVDSIPLDMEGMVLGNAQARARMLILYTYSNQNDLLVLGTSNKTELMLGYFTKYGDGAADIYPLGDLYKNQVRELAGELAIPEGIRDRPPSAALIEGQTDEGEIGLPYPILDQVIAGYLGSLSTDEILDSVDLSMVDPDQMDRSGFEPPLLHEHIQMVLDMIKASRHKRWSLAVPKISASTVGFDLRERW